MKTYLSVLAALALAACGETKDTYDVESVEDSRPHQWDYTTAMCNAGDTLVAGECQTIGSGITQTTNAEYDVGKWQDNAGPLWMCSFFNDSGNWGEVHAIAHCKTGVP